jgi:uncharacterized damage-inducible protein DinB
MSLGRADSGMAAMVGDLVRHKLWANAALIQSVRQHDVASRDDDLRTLLHHIIVADRFWFALSRGEPFDVAAESTVATMLDDLVKRYRETHEAQLRWIATVDDRELERLIETPYIPGQRYSIAQAAVQVCLHSHGHRAQVATRLRALGGTPPSMDYIRWLPERPAAQWD